MSITNTTQEAVMGKPVPVQHPAVVLRSQYRNLRSLVAVLLVALAALTTSVVILANDGNGTAATTTFVGKAPQGDPFEARTQQTQPQGGVNESAAAILQSGSRSYPTLADSFQSQVEQPKPQGGSNESTVAGAISQPHAVSAPDESKIAASLAKHADTGPQARAQAWQAKLDSMTSQQRAHAFVRGH
jgi:hypothetical protein